MKKSELRQIIKEEIKLLMESPGDFYISNELATMKGMTEYRADTLISEFNKRGPAIEQRKFWQLRREKQYKKAAKIVWDWDKAGQPRRNK